MWEKRFWVAKCEQGLHVGVVTEGEHESDALRFEIPCPLHSGEEDLDLCRVSEAEYVEFCAESDDADV